MIQEYRDLTSLCKRTISLAELRHAVRDGAYLGLMVERDRYLRWRKQRKM